MRSAGPALQLWDVRDAEAHVRTLADAGLRDMGAHYLEPSKKDDLVAFLLAECWRISGMAADGITPRREYLARVRVSLAAPRWSSIHGVMHERFVFTCRCHTAVDARDRAEASILLELGEAIVSFDVFERRPRGAYDPARGLAFSTYSRRILTRRIVDWYRQTFGDARYGDRPQAVSYEGLLEEYERRNGTGAAEAFLDRRSPGARLDHVDELNTHVYDHEIFEEVAASAIAR